MTSFRVVGPGRAGLSLHRALSAAGWTALPPLGRHDDLAGAASGVDLVLVCVPDSAVASVAAAITPSPTAVVAHVAGSLGLDVLASHPRVASVHPLVALPDADLGVERLTAGAWFAVAGDPIAADVVAALGGRAIEVDDLDRPAYHAAAVIASNHLVALLGQVERVAESVGVPLEAYLSLVRATLDNVAARGPAGALTGPVARGDWATVGRHLAALDPSERDAYSAMATAAARVAGRTVDADLDVLSWSADEELSWL